MVGRSGTQPELEDGIISQLQEYIPYKKDVKITVKTF